jgi:hypothetical protein
MIAKRFSAALKGRQMWLKLKRKYDIDNGAYVLLMPEDDCELNGQALLHIKDLLAHRKARGVIILTNKEWVIKKAKDYSDGIIAVKNISEKDIDNLLSFYELYDFSERLLVVSLTKPFGRKLFGVKGVNGVTVEDLVCICIFLIRDWVSSEVKDG